MARQDDIIVGLDFGTTKICAVVGQINEAGKVDIIGVGKAPSHGIRKGVVVNIESTVEAVKQAVNEAELMAGCEFNSVYAGIAGGHIKGFNSHGVVAIRNNEVTQLDIQRVIEAAKAIAIPLDREVIHIVPQEYIIDEQDGIHDPLGMNGTRLECKVHIVTGAVSAAQNIIKCANKCGLNVSDIVLEPLASAESVLTPEEKELGVALIDIGGGTTDLAIFSGGSIVHTSVLALGGNHITNDIAIGLRTPAIEAERIKVAYGCTMRSQVKENETIEVPGVGGRKARIVSRSTLAEIIEPRVEEIFSLVQREVSQSGYLQTLGGGIVITGGSTLLDGMTELAEFIFDLPVKRGMPINVDGLVDVVRSPIFSTAVGLVLYGARERSKNRFKIREENVYQKVRTRMKSWFGEVF